MARALKFRWGHGPSLRHLPRGYALVGNAEERARRKARFEQIVSSEPLIAAQLVKLDEDDRAAVAIEAVHLARESENGGEHLHGREVRDKNLEIASWLVARLPRQYRAAWTLLLPGPPLGRDYAQPPEHEQRSLPGSLKRVALERSFSRDELTLLRLGGDVSIDGHVWRISCRNDRWSVHALPSAALMFTVRIDARGYETDIAHVEEVWMNGDRDAPLKVTPAKASRIVSALLDAVIADPGVPW